MAYFQRSSSDDPSYIRQFAPAAGEDWQETDDEDEDEPIYDDGFDELMEDGEEMEIPEEGSFTENEWQEERRRKFRTAAGIGNFGATIFGVAAILLLVAFLISMLRFISSDFSQNFSLLQTKF